MVKLFNNVIGAMSPWALVDIVFYHYVFIYNYNSQGAFPPQQSVVIGETVRAQTMRFIYMYFTRNHKSMCYVFISTPSLQYSNVNLLSEVETLKTTNSMTQC